MTEQQITAAAILQDGEIYTLPKPARHHNIIRHMAAKGLPIPIQGRQGFVDDAGTFLDRRDAATVALKTRQIQKLMSPPNLFSEDLW